MQLSDAKQITDLVSLYLEVGVRYISRGGGGKDLGCFNPRQAPMGWGNIMQVM